MTTSLRSFMDQGLFSTFSLTTALEQADYHPRIVEQLDLFVTDPISDSINPIIETRITRSQISNLNPWGVITNVMTPVERRGAHGMSKTIGTIDSVSKQDVLGVRAFGRIGPETVFEKLNEKTISIRENCINPSVEHYRREVLFGRASSVDDPTNVVWDWFDFFGVTQTEQDLDPSTITGAGQLAAWLKSIRNKIQDALRGIRLTGYIAILGDNYWDAFMGIDSVNEALKYSGNGVPSEHLLRSVYDINPNDEIPVDLTGVLRIGGMHFINYRETLGFDPDQAIFVPKGAGIFRSVLTQPSWLTADDFNMVPANKTEQFASSDMFVHQYVPDHDRNIQVEVERNALEINMMPHACVHSKLVGATPQSFMAASVGLGGDAAPAVQKTSTKRNSTSSAE